MHDEDNENGLIVTSKAAQNEGHTSWIAYGDKMLHHTKNSANFKENQEIPEKCQAIVGTKESSYDAAKVAWKSVKVYWGKCWEWIVDPRPKQHNFVAWGVKYWHGSRLGHGRSILRRMD